MPFLAQTDMSAVGRTSSGFIEPLTGV